VEANMKVRVKGTEHLRRAEQTFRDMGRAAEIAGEAVRVHLETWTRARRAVETMIGNRVRVLRQGSNGTSVVTDGVLHKLDATGATIYRESSVPEGRGIVFIPMTQIIEIVHLGRAP
jgi:hypothetical protein